MVNRENVLREVLSQLENRRTENLKQEQERRALAQEKSAELSELLKERQQLFYGGMKVAFSSPQKAKAISEDMQSRMKALNAEIRAALLRAGLPQDYLQPIYQCALCRDTGYVGEPIHEQCSCLRRLVMNRLYENEGLSGLERENFDRFDETIFPDEPIPERKLSQRGYILRIRSRCERYAEEFAAGKGTGLLFFGRSGLGKTFLLNCVAQRVLERGFSVMVISAYKLVETMRRYQFSGEEAEQVQDLLTCDLLCIDDLGSEPMLRGVTVSALYHIINERRCADRSVVISTNCSVDQLYEKYDDRVAARLCDPGRMQMIEFVGVDVRRYAAQRG